MSTAKPRPILTLLFNPFRRVAGWPALGLGLAAILLTGWIGSLSGTHFDGVLDMHTGPASVPLWFFLAEGLIDWLALALVLLAAGRLASRSAFRAVDLLGTQALARWPMLLAALACLPPGYRRFTAYLVEQVQKGKLDPGLLHPDAAVFFSTLLVAMLATVWMVALMYRSFSLCCNVRGGRAIGAFVAGLLVAEVLSKVVIVLWMKRL